MPVCQRRPKFKLESHLEFISLLELIVFFNIIYTTVSYRIQIDKKINLPAKLLAYIRFEQILTENNSNSKLQI